jgi:hypothetical protein
MYVVLYMLMYYSLVYINVEYVKCTYCLVYNTLNVQEHR